MFVVVLICHRKLTIVLIPIGKGKGDDVISSVGDVDLDARGRDGRGAINWATCRRGYFNGNLAKVLGEDHCEIMSIDGGLDGACLWCIMRS